MHRLLITSRTSTVIKMPKMILPSRTYTSISALQTFIPHRHKYTSTTEKLVNEIRERPLEAYIKFYNNQYNANHNNEVIYKIVNEINMRLENSIFNLDKFKDAKKSFINIRQDGLKLLSGGIINPNKLSTFVMDYVETMFELLRSHDKNINGTYHTQFAKGIIN